MTKNFCITTGITSKKLIFPFLFSLVQIIIDIADYQHSSVGKETNTILNSFSIGLGQMLVLIVPTIKIFSDKSKLNIIKENYSKKAKFCHYFIYYFIFSLLITSILITSSLDQKKLLSSPHLYGASSKEAFQIFIVTLLSFFLLNNKYKLHNIISLIFFVIISFSIDFILKNIQKEIEEPLIFFLDNIMNVILETLQIIYEKYMIETLYYSHWNVCFSLGLFLFSTNFIVFLVILIKGKKKLKKFPPYLKGFYDYFDNYDYSFIILHHIICILLNFFLHVFRYLTLYNFPINHLLICYEISKIVKILIVHKENKDIYYCLILFLLQFLFLMFYLEILEFNCCSLNKNTKKNIMTREVIDMEFNNNNRNQSLVSLMDINPDYSFRDSSSGLKV